MDPVENDTPENEDGSAKRLIPLRNAHALSAYYCGVFSLIPGFGLVLGPVAFTTGLQGLRISLENRNAGGAAHAIAGIALGAFTFLATLAFMVVAGSLLLYIYLMRMNNPG